MSNVESRLAHLGATAAEAPSDSTIARDLTNASQARVRRNHRRARIAAGTCLGAAAVAFTVNATLVPHASAPSISDRSQPLSLVSYSGDQEPGFIIDKVPEGYVLQGSTGAVLDVARADDTSPLEVFDHKLVVTVAPLSEVGQPQGTPVTINGEPGALRTAADGTRTVSYVDGSLVVVVQVWADINLDQNALVEFADGITVTTGAQPVHG